jgi:hypothetical protein
MNGFPSQMGTPSQMGFTPSTMGSMMGSASQMDGRSPFFVRGVPMYSRQVVTVPDVSKHGEGLFERASAADEEMKRRLVTQQYGTGLQNTLICECGPAEVVRERRPLH